MKATMSNEIDSRNSATISDLDIKISDGSNYHEWADMLMIYLALHNFDGFMDGTITNSANTPTNTKASEKAPSQTSKDHRLLQPK